MDDLVGSDPPLESTRRKGLVGLGICIAAGTLVRLYFGLNTREWEVSTDQLAWNLLLQEDAPLRVDHLFHYPHEGATPILSLIALLISPFASFMPPLSWTALVVETGSRTIQVATSYRVFGLRTALWFGLWTVFAVPGLIPWATVNFGLHALSAFWPFLLLWLLCRPLSQTRQFVVVGLVLGLAVSWAYDSVVLVPVAIVALLSSPFGRDKIKLTAIALGVACLVFVPYWFARQWMDLGFALEPRGLFWVRGVTAELPSVLTWWEHFRVTWTHTIPGSSVLPAGWGVDLDLVRLCWGILIYLGVVLSLRHPRRPLVVGVAFVLVYGAFYSASPFWFDLRDHDSHNSFMHYRHFAYILPLLSLLAIHGFVTFKKGAQSLAIIVILVGAAGTARYTLRPHEPHDSVYRAAGWTLGRKLGHSPPRLARLAAIPPGDAGDELVRGFGWGIAETLLSPTVNHEPTSEEVTLLAQTVADFPESIRPLVIQGVFFFLQSHSDFDLDSVQIQELRNQLLH